MKRNDIFPFSGKKVEIIIMPDAEKVTGVIKCKDDHVEINGSLLAYELIWGIKIIDVPAAKIQPSESKASSAKNFYAQANAYAQAGQSDKAEEFYIKAVKADDHRSKAVNILFAIFMQRGNYKAVKNMLDTYGSALNEDTLMHHLACYYFQTKDDCTEFLKQLAKKIKSSPKGGEKKKFFCIRTKANLEYSSWKYMQAVSTCNTGLEAFASLSGNIPKELEHIPMSLKRIKALALHAAGSKKAVTLAQELMSLPEMQTDIKLLAILESAK